MFWETLTLWNGRKVYTCLIRVQKEKEERSNVWKDLCWEVFKTNERHQVRTSRNATYSKHDKYK